MRIAFDMGKREIPVLWNQREEISSGERRSAEMRKRVSLILAAALMLSLAACGGGNSDSNSPVNDNNEESSVLEMNDTATSGDWSFALTGVEFADTLTTDPNPNSPYYLRPADEEYSGSWYTPDSGNIYLYFTAELGYSGKETAEIGTWSENHIGFIIRYGDGYTFDTYEFVIEDGQGYYNVDETFEPLSASRQCKVYFEVPIELQSDTENPLELVVSLPGGNGENAEFVYDIR